MEKQEILFIGRNLNHARWQAISLYNDMFGKEAPWHKFNRQLMENDFIRIRFGSFNSIINLRGMRADKIFVDKSISYFDFEEIKYLVKTPQDIYFFLS